MMTPETDPEANTNPEATPAGAAPTDVAYDATASTECALLASIGIFY